MDPVADLDDPGLDDVDLDDAGLEPAPDLEEAGRLPAVPGRLPPSSSPAGGGDGGVSSSSDMAANDQSKT